MAELRVGTDQDGEYFFYYEINYGGIPGRPAGDGLDVHAWWPNFTAIPVEYAESYFPVRVERLRGRIDSGGAGKHRGGNGMDKVYLFLEPGEVSVHDDRHRSRPWGIGGGQAAECSRKILLLLRLSEPVICTEVGLTGNAFPFIHLSEAQSAHRR